MRISRSPIMVRPTLIVGLGGTGVLICRWVEEFVRRLFGCVPPFIRFLKLDTDALEEGGPANAGESDFVNLFHYMDLGEVVRDFAEHPELHGHLSWLHGLRLDASFADYGCQGIPRLGRVVFVELRESLIHKEVSSRFSDLRTSTQKPFDGDGGQFLVAPDGAPAVHVVSSVCGGTGAGMLIDIAYNVRWWSRESFPRSAEVIGHLMLPEAFNVDPIVRPKLETNAVATLEQIEFLMDSRRDDVPVRYRVQRRGEDRFNRLTAPFNFLYLLNGHGDTGAGNRRHLVRMIARVIRAMTLEPTAQHVASDANNQLNDILGQFDPANGRRQCFGSYGYWYGRPGHQHTDVESWVCSALEALGSGPTAGQTDYADEVGRELVARLDVSGKADSVGQPSDPFAWEMPSGDVTDAKRLADVVQHVVKYLEKKAVPATRQEAGKILPPEKPHEELLQSAQEMILRDVFQSAPLAPLGQVGVCLNQWIGQLDQWVRNERGVGRPDARTVQQEIVKDARGRLDELATKMPPSSWTPEDVDPVVREVIDDRWRDLADVCLRENRLKSASETLTVFRLRKDALHAVASSAGRLHGTVSTPTSDTTGQGEFFSTPLYAASDPTTDAHSVLARQFREDLIKPIVQHLVLDAKSANVQAVTDGLKTIGKRLEEKMRAFLETAESDDSTTFHSRLRAEQRPPDHRYYKPVSNVLRLAGPKVDLIRSGVFAPTMEVGISQQVANCCVPQLLEYNVGSSFREAEVTEAFEKGADAWFQLLCLRYGFCLEAISTTRNYAAATEDYVNKRGFTYADVWLDRDWYGAYKACLAAWKKDMGDRRKADRVDRETYDAVAADIHRFRRSLQDCVAKLRNGVRSAITDSGMAFDLRGPIEKTGLVIEQVIEKAGPDKPAEFDRIKARCRTILQDLHDELGEMLSGLSSEDQERMRTVLETFQASLEPGDEGPLPTMLGTTSPQGLSSAPTPK